MKKPLVAATTIAIVLGAAALAAALLPHGAPKIGPPFITTFAPGDPLSVYMPMSNPGRGETQVNIGIWGSPLDISHGTLNGLEKHPANQDTRGCGPIIISSNTTFFLSSYQTYDPQFPNYLLGEIAHKRKYPVHLGYGWRRGSLEGNSKFVIPLDKDIVLAVPKDAH